MKMRSPVTAMLWEMWRVTRVEAAWRMALGLGAALLALAVFAVIAPAGNPEKFVASRAWIAVDILLFLQMVGWVSLAKRYGGRPGFPLRLHFTRPVRTTVLVGIPMAYLTLASVGIYLLSALLMKVITGYPVPLLPVAAGIVAYVVLATAAAWSSRSLATLVLPGMVWAVTWFSVFAHHIAAEKRKGFDWQESPALWPRVFDIPPAFYALVALIALVSFAVTCAFVSRQRHGDTRVPIVAGSAGWLWLINLFRLPCPTSSATRAQLWFELKSRGLPLLLVAVVLAMVIPLLFAVSGPIDAAIWNGRGPDLSCAKTGCFYARPFAALFATLSFLVLLGLGSANVFGILRKRRFACFEATQPYGTRQMASLKLFVRSACLLIALTVVAVSVWTAAPLLGDAFFVQIWNGSLSAFKVVVKEAVDALAGYELLALAVVAVAGIILWVAALAVRGALWTRYSRRMNMAASLVLLCTLALALLQVAERYALVSPSLVDGTFTATRWIAAAALVFATAYLFWSCLAELVLTVRYVSIALVIAVVIATAFMTARMAVQHVGGVQSALNPSSTLLPLLLLLMASALVPWSLNRVRHV